MYLPINTDSDPAQTGILPEDVPALQKVIAQKKAEIESLERDRKICPSNAKAIDRRIMQLRLVIASCSRLAAAGNLRTPVAGGEKGEPEIIISAIQ